MTSAGYAQASFDWNPQSQSLKLAPMYRAIKNVTLKNGESAELGVLSIAPGVALPDQQAELRKKVRGLLGHKGPVWMWQIEQCLTPACGVESFFYLLSRQGEFFANICTFEQKGVGILGHVYTRPEERRKGAAEVLMDATMSDFRARNGRALYLGTGYASSAYKVY